jgi:RNA polymerase sigma factor (sigma-70 family)
MLDRELLQKFVESHSQEAFALIVERYMDAVYSAARRQVRDSQSAEDVVQAVFIILAKKAHKLIGRESLAGWIMKTTHHASLDAIKIQARRQRHEQIAASLASSLTEPTMNPEIDSISPELDRAMARLSESERTALTLRYLQDKTNTQTVALLQISEQAAAKRISRAVGRLRKILVKKRAVAPAVSLAVILDQIPRTTAPVALAQTAALSAVSGAAPPGVAAIAKGVLHMLTWQKIAAALLLIVALASVTGVGIGGYKLLADQTDSISPPPPPSPAGADEQTRSAALAQLSNGVSIEIIGINENPSGGRQWWQVDGEAVNSDLHADVHALSVNPGDMAREVVAKVNRNVQGSAEPATVQWFLNHGSVTYSGNSNIPGTETVATELPNTANAGAIRARVAAGNWQALATAGGTGQTAEGGLVGEYLFSAVYRDQGKTNIVVGFMGKVTREDVRLVAVDFSGRQVPAESGSSVSNGAGTMTQYSVDLPPRSIRQWQLQSRPFNQWIEFRDISLHRGQKTNAQILTSDTSKNEQSPGN